MLMLVQKNKIKMRTNRISLDNNFITGRLHSSLSTPQNSNLGVKRRRIVTARRNYSEMVGQDMVFAKENKQQSNSANNVVSSEPFNNIHTPKVVKNSTIFNNKTYPAAQTTAEGITLINKVAPSSAQMIRSSGSVATTTEKVTESVLARQFDVEELDTSNSKKGRRLAARFRNFASRATTVLAAVVFLAGAYVVFDGYRTNRQIKTQVQQVSAAVDNGGATTSEGLPSETPPSDSLENYKVAADMPRFLEISSLGVKSRVVRMGVTPDGAVQAPSNIYDSGWYDGSAKPGQPGAAFIDGHVSGYTQPGVFKQIKNLKQNDVMKVEMGDGTQYSYKVVKVESYPADSVDMTKVLAPVTAGKQGLNIMTCGGSFDNSTHQYKERVVVFTERI